VLTEEVDVIVQSRWKRALRVRHAIHGPGIADVVRAGRRRHAQIEPSQVVVFEGDSAIVRSGGGSGGSRSLQLAATPVLSGAIALVARGRELAARALEAAASDIEYKSGHYRIAGTDRSVSLFALAATEPGAEITLTASATATGRRGRTDVRWRKSKSTRTPVRCD